MPVDKEQFIAGRLAKIATQYRDSKFLICHIEAHLEEVYELVKAAEELEVQFDVDVATGRMLEIIGGIVGMPKTFCQAAEKRFFGLQNTLVGERCTPYNTVGFCHPDGNWRCSQTGERDREDYTFTDDELYRKYIKAKIIKNHSDGTAESLIRAARAIFGDTANLHYSEKGIAILTTGRDLTEEEQRVLPLSFVVLPVVIASTLYVYIGDRPYDKDNPDEILVATLYDKDGLVIGAPT